MNYLKVNIYHSSHWGSKKTIQCINIYIYFGSLRIILIYYYIIMQLRYPNIPLNLPARNMFKEIAQYLEFSVLLPDVISFPIMKSVPKLWSYRQHFVQYLAEVGNKSTLFFLFFSSQFTWHMYIKIKKKT